jgi:nucleoside-diphosphate-sugar epimerase
VASAFRRKIERKEQLLMRVLITGGAGFVGSHLAEALLERGDEVFILDNLSTGSIDNVVHLKSNPKFHYTIDTVSNEPVVAELIDRCDTVVHLAAAVGVKLIVEQPVHTIETNVHGTEVVLKHANKKKKLVLIASTSEVYGKSADVPFREDADLVLGPTEKHRWAYACSKMIDEFLALAYWKERKLPVIVVRLFNTVGPRQTGQYGMVIPNLVQQALAGQPITVFGDGTQSRSFTYVGDVVKAMVALIDEPRAVGQVFNIGNGKEITIRALAEKIKDMTDSSSEIVMVPYDKAYEAGFEDMPRRVPDIGRIQALVGYRPTVELDETLRRVIEHFRQL